MCKKWKFVIETMIAKQANVCIHSKVYPYKEKWCFSEAPVAEEDMLYVKYVCPPSRQFDFKIPFFEHLHKVYLCEIGENVDCFLEEVKLLANLKVLMIHEEQIKCRTLSSASLERLSVKCSDFGPIKLDTPMLSCFVLWNNFKRFEQFETVSNRLVDIQFPLKIKRLECFRFDLNLNRLKNLETLVCRVITFEFQLNDFKSLVRLEIFPRTERELPVIRRIQDDRERLNRTDLELIVSGFKETPIICNLNGGYRNLFESFGFK